MAASSRAVARRMAVLLAVAVAGGAACGDGGEPSGKGAAAPGQTSSAASGVQGPAGARSGGAAAPAGVVRHSADGAAAPPGKLDSASAADSARSRPATKPGVIAIEGFNEWIGLNLYRTPAGFPLPFSTYIPADMLVEGSESAITVMANFASRRNDRVFMRLTPAPGAGTATAAQADAHRTAATRGRLRAPQPRRYAWSLAEYPYERPAAAGNPFGLVALGRHGDRYFLVVIEYPAEYAEGFLPRVNRVLQELRWSDTGAGLSSRT